MLELRIKKARFLLPEVDGDGNQQRLLRDFLLLQVGEEFFKKDPLVGGAQIDDDKPVGGFGQQMAVAEAAADAQGGQIAVDGPLRLLLDRRVRRLGRRRGRIDGGRPVWQRQ